VALVFIMTEAFRTVEFSHPSLTPPGVHFATVKSPALRRRADVSFYVPPGQSAASLPRVVLLHGVYGSHWAWLFKGAAHEVLNHLIKHEGLPPMLLAMPSDGLWGDGSGYLRHADADYSRWIVEEVPRLASELEPRSAGSPVFIAGLSMGGWGALRLGALHPELFAGISAHSSITEMGQMQGFVAEYPEGYDLIEERPLQALECLKLNAHRLPPVRFDCGTEDLLIEPNRHLHQALERAGIGHVYEEFPGGHTWEYWREHLADSLRFFGGLLS
jgi:putative tributyrin esterase